MIKLNHKELSEYILATMNEDTVIELATEYDGNDTEEDKEVWNNYSSWYFIKLVKIEGYDSRFLLIDYCGGEEAYVIPLSNYHYDNKLFTEDDEVIIKRYIKHWFERCTSLGDTDLPIWVDDRKGEE